MSHETGSPIQRPFSSSNNMIDELKSREISSHLLENEIPLTQGI